MASYRGRSGWLVDDRSGDFLDELVHAQSAGTPAHQAVPGQGRDGRVQDEGISERREMPGSLLSIVGRRLDRRDPRALPGLVAC